MTVPQNDSPFDMQSTRPPENVDYHLRTLREDILSKAYQRTFTYPDELQPLPKQQDVQQNRKFLLNDALYLQVKFTDPHSPESVTTSTSIPGNNDAFYRNPQSFFYPFNPCELSRYS